MAILLIFRIGIGANLLQQKSGLLEVLLPQALYGGTESSICILEELPLRRRDNGWI